MAAAQDLFHLYIGLPVTEADATVFRFTWKLFIVAKARLFSPFPDLVASFNLLICVLAFVYCHVPAAQRAVPLTDETNLPRRSKEGAVDILQVIVFHFVSSCRCPIKAWQVCRLAGCCLLASTTLSSSYSLRAWEDAREMQGLGRLSAAKRKFC